MKTKLIFTIFLFLGMQTMAQNRVSEKLKSEISTLLEIQVNAWNEGNLEKFMDTYWHSEKLVFVGSRGPTYGWEATLAGYKKGYPDMASMGKLKLTLLDMAKIDRKTVFVIGRFDLKREAGNLSGHFTLVIQKIGNNWLIVSDHSSSAG